KPGLAPRPFPIRQSGLHHYSSLILPLATTSLAQSYCVLISLANSSGVLPEGAAPCFSSVSTTLGSFRATTAASRSFLMISGGVPAGASKPYQAGWFSWG